MKKFEPAEIEVVVFVVGDVLTSSGETETEEEEL
jgi:hypothetical protein